MADAVQPTAREEQARRLAETLRRRWRPLLAAVVLAAVVLAPDLAHAGGFGSEVMPWDGPLVLLVKRLTGPFAFLLSMLVVVIAAVLIVAGRELDDFLRRLIFAVGVLAALVMLVNLASPLAAP